MTRKAHRVENDAYWFGYGLMHFPHDVWAVRSVVEPFLESLEAIMPGYDSEQERQLRESVEEKVGLDNWGVDHGPDFKFRDNLASLMRQRDKILSGGLLTAAAVLHMNADDRAIVERLVRANRAEHLLGELFAMLCLPRNRETLRGPAGGDALEELLRIVDKWKEEYDRGKGKQRQGEVSDRGGDKGRSEGSS